MPDHSTDEGEVEKAVGVAGQLALGTARLALELELERVFQRAKVGPPEEAGDDHGTDRDTDHIRVAFHAGED